MSKLFNPALWAGMIPNGIGQIKPNHYWDMVKVTWENRGNLPYAWRILNQGVCDGCALGTKGMHDFTMDGVHLCTVRLKLLKLNTMPALDPALLSDVAALHGKSSKELRDLGRLPYPMLRKKGDRGFRRIAWDEALDLAGAKIRDTDPRRIALYLTSRGITNEVYYVAQKAARFLGTNNVDNAARLCHSPSTVALKQTLGVAASTCSYKDWIGTDLLIFFGSNTPNNQPVTTKYMYYAKQQGTRIVVVNPYREPGLERYWVPSVFESAVFGTKLADDFFSVNTGGDLAFINGVIKGLLERNVGTTCIDENFIRAHTSGFDELKAALQQQSWEMLEKESGTTRAELFRFVEMFGKAKSAVFVWSMGITHHVTGVDNVKAIVNLALMRGMVGREKCGLMPIRGHSGVQGGGEMGCNPNNFPGGDPINAQTAPRFEQLWGFPVPRERGLMAPEMLNAAHARELDVLYAVGGNFLETLPEPDRVHAALERVPLRIHQDIVLTSQMLVDPADTVLLLPACTRYEQRGGGTETSTERYIYFSPEIAGPRIGEARTEWEILMQIAERAHPERKQLIHFGDCQQIRNEIAKAVPAYEGIQTLQKTGDAVQWGGPLLCANGAFKTGDGKARFTPVAPASRDIPEGCFLLSTRRGKQFNSIVQEDRDPLNGAMRDDILMNADDALALELKDGDAIVISNEIGQFRGRVKIAKIQSRNLQGHWPELNVVLKQNVCNAESGVPDYNALVKIGPA